MPATTLRELKEWRLRAGRPADSEPIIGPMTQNARKPWSRRVIRPAARRVTGRTDTMLYTLRHTHASALHYSDFTVPAAAKRLGHGASLHVEGYAHVIDSVRGQRFASLEALIATARAEAAQGDAERADAVSR